MEKNIISIIDWKQRRYEIAKEIATVIYADTSLNMTEERIAETAIIQADALISKLKEE